VALSLRWKANAVVPNQHDECIAVNGVVTTCQSEGETTIQTPHVLPLTTLVQLAAGDVLTVRIRANIAADAVIAPSVSSQILNELSIVFVSP
jgi:hypothetical protein